jgi:hypothetical protein
VPGADDHAPAAPADRDRLAVGDPSERLRHLRHQRRKVLAHPGAQRLELRTLGHAVAAVVTIGGRGVGARHRHRQDAPHRVLAERHPQRRGEAVAEHARQADVVGVGVRAQHPDDRQTLELLGDHGLPVAAQLVGRDAAADQRPAVAAPEGVAQQPEVDVVQREGQRHAQPVHARRDPDLAPGLGQRVCEGIAQLVLVRIHRG